MICGSPSGTSEFSHGNSTPLCLLEVYTATHLSEPNFITQLSAVKPRLGIGTGYTKHKGLVQCIGIHIGHKLKAEWNIAVPHGNLHITTLADIEIKSSHYLCLDIMADESKWSLVITATKPEWPKPKRFVAVSVCDRFCCGRFGLWQQWPVTLQNWNAGQISIFCICLKKHCTDGSAKLSKHLQTKCVSCLRITLD